MTQRISAWRRALTLCASLAGALSGLSGCYFPEASLIEVSLTPAQEAHVKAQLLSEAPSPQRALNVTFGEAFKLIGVDVSATEVRPGESVTVTYYIEGLSDEPQDYKVLTHLQGRRRGAWQNLDHVPVRGLFPLHKLRRGQVIKDVHTFRVKPTYPATSASLYWGLYQGKERLAHSTPKGVKHDGKRRVEVATLKVTGQRYTPTAKARPLSADHTITLDGKLDEPAWAETSWTRFWGHPSGKRVRAPLTRAKFLWSADALYIAVEARDDDVWGTLTERDSDTWTQEVVELFIDADGDHRDYLELQVTPANVVFDARFKHHRSDLKAARAWDMAGFESAVWVDGTLNERGDQDRAWYVELKVPVAEVPGAQAQLASGQQWRFNMFRFDAPKGERQQAAALSPPLVPDFHALDAFARLKLLGPLTASTPKASTPKASTPKASTPKTPLSPR